MKREKKLAHREAAGQGEQAEEENQHSHTAANGNKSGKAGGRALRSFTSITEAIAADENEHEQHKHRHKHLDSKETQSLIEDI